MIQAAYGYPEAMMERVKVLIDAYNPYPVLFILYGKVFESFSIQESVLFLSDDSVDLKKIISEKEGFDRRFLAQSNGLVNCGIKDIRIQAI